MISLAEQITEVQRELAMRANVYPRFVREHKMRQEEADKRVARLTAVLESLRNLQRSETPELPL